MKYKKPVCECGGELQTTAAYCCDIIYNINSNGKKAKKPKYSTDTQDGEHLECKSCDNAYFIEIDDKSRIIRGEEYDII